MTPLSCDQVEQQLELFVLDEVHEPQRSAVRAHLAGCSACTRSLAEARQLLGQLDIRFREREGLARIRDRIDAEEGRRTARPRVLHFPRQLAALAAALLLVIGLAGPPAAPPGRRAAEPGPSTFHAVPGRGPEAMVLPKDSEPEPKFIPDTFTLAGGARVRPSTDAIWRRLDGNQVELTSGTLLVVSGQPAAVKTPAGVAVTPRGEFRITVGPVRNGLASGPVVVVRISAGTVRLRTPSGIITGNEGDVLRADPGSPPRRSATPPQKKGREP